MAKMREIDFINSTYDPAIFTINNVCNDNACFYRAAANFIYYAQPSESIRQLKKLKPLDWGKTKSIQTVQRNFGNFSENQDTLARTIQKHIVNFIKNNPEYILPETGMSIQNSIVLIHDITFDEYLASYNMFAGDFDIDSDSDEDIIDRWGSIIEQSVLSIILKIPIIVFNTQKFDKRHQKIINGKIIKNKPEKDVRLKFSSISGLEYRNALPIFLIWREYHRYGHYLVCYPNSINDIHHLVTNMLN